MTSWKHKLFNICEITISLFPKFTYPCSLLSTKKSQIGFGCPMESLCMDPRQNLENTVLVAGYRSLPCNLHQQDKPFDSLWLFWSLEILQRKQNLTLGSRPMGFHISSHWYSQVKKIVLSEQSFAGHNLWLPRCKWRTSNKCKQFIHFFKTNINSSNWKSPLLTSQQSSCWHFAWHSAAQETLIDPSTIRVLAFRSHTKILEISKECQSRKKSG